MNAFVVCMFLTMVAFGVEIYYLVKDKGESKELLNKLSALSADLQKMISEFKTDQDGQQAFVKAMIVDDGSEKNEVDPNEKIVYDSKWIVGDANLSLEKVEDQAVSLVSPIVTKPKTRTKKAAKTPRKYQKKTKTVSLKS